MQQIEIEMIGLALSQRDVKKSDIVYRTGKRMPGELIGKVITVSGVLSESLGYGDLRVAAEIRISGVEVIHTVFYCQIEHGVDPVLIDRSGHGIRGEPHASEA